MATVRPFCAVRPGAEKAAEVMAPPYDVMDRSEACALAEGRPCSFLHISRSEIDLPEEADPYCRKVYEKARDNLQQFIEDGVLTEDEKPCFYIYRQEMNGRFQTGIAACFSVDEYENNTIKKHELTRFDKELDRINHFDICGADTEPVFLTYRSSGTVNRLIEDYKQNHSPVYDFTAADGVGHTLWVVDEPQIIEELAGAFEKVDSLYIADGHHRSASAYEVGKRYRKENPDFDGSEEFNFFMAVIYPDSELKIFDYNRVVKGLNGYTQEQLLEKIAAAGFAVEDKGTEPYRPQKTHQCALYLGGRWYSMTADPSIIPEDVIGSLDVSILQNRVLGPVLGIEDPRSDDRIDFVGGIRGLKELVRRAESDMDLAFAMYPVTMEELMHIADCGEIMPPKSTWFEPKPGSGLFLHRL